MNIFLKAKHWQLFSVLVGIPFLLYIVFMIQMVSTMEAIDQNSENFDADNIVSYVSGVMAGTLILTSVMLMWFWSLGVKLQDYIPIGAKLKTGFFKFSIWYPIIYIFLIVVLMIYVGNVVDSGSSSAGPPLAIFIFFPLHFFAMFCMFYNLYFVARTIKTAELQRPVNFGDYAGEFFLMWFYFIGIWIVQPKVNRIYEGQFQPDVMDHLH
jgi:hypothetical protein